MGDVVDPRGRIPAAVAPPRAYAHHGLRGLLDGLDGPRGGWSGTVTFRAPDELISVVPSAATVIVPALNDPQAEFLARLRSNLCLTPILAVVDDLVGHQTSRAMHSGATSVLNLELPPVRQAALLDALLGEPRLPCRAPDEGRLPGDTGDEPDDGRSAALSAEQATLVDLLCGTDTVAAIARRFFCSERSMYRRVRALYETLGVGGRSELRMLQGRRVA